MPRYDIPADLGDAFSVDAALARGVGEKRLRGADLERPYRGVRVRRLSAAVQDGEPDGPAALLRARTVAAALQYALRMPDHEFFSHETAALLWDAPLPPASAYSPRLRRPRDGGILLHVSVLAPHRLPRGAGVRGHEAQPALTRIVRDPATGLRVSSPATTWAMLGAVLRHPYDLIAVGDHMIRVPRMPGGFDKRMPPPLAAPAHLEAALFAGRRVGKPALREALPLLRTGSSSRPETWMRLILVHAGLPEPVLDFDVYAADGRFIGCLDGAYPQLRIGLEYEGDHHRTDVATWNRDIRKHEDLAAEGWRVIRVTREMVFTTPGDLVRRVVAARRARS